MGNKQLEGDRGNRTSVQRSAIVLPNELELSSFRALWPPNFSRHSFPRPSSAVIEQSRVQEPRRYSECVLCTQND